MLYDVFISYASEDRESFVQPLAEKLRELHVEVWYDEFSLQVGDSLRASIDKGLSKSRFGIVVLSPDFCRKRWPARELNGLIAREMTQDEPVVLPIWHDIELEQILKFSPPLADVKALNSKSGIEPVCRALLHKIKPKESPLVTARDELIYWGMNPPVISDEWWLDVVEASNRLPAGGAAIPEQSMWGRWTFPLPNRGATGEARGVRLAWTALQMQWEKLADEIPITQCTKPEVVLSFIRDQPGLSETCHEFPRYLATYAPQLVIPGFGGEYEADFEQLAKDRRYRDETALRASDLSVLDPAYVACEFVQGGEFGPSPRYYDHFVYVVWILSRSSAWLPPKIRDLLTVGMREWPVWGTNKPFEFDDPFSCDLQQYQEGCPFELSAPAKAYLLRLITQSLQELRNSDDPNAILQRLISEGFIEWQALDRSTLRRRKGLGA